MTKQSALSDKKFIVTAGGTVEKIDPVRFISNRSSGKMGIAVADAASEIGLETVLICGNVDAALIAGKKYRVLMAESTIDMLRLVTEELCENSVLVMAAAPADFRVKNYSERKIKKNNDDVMTIELIKNPDILKASSEMRRTRGWKNTILAGFAAETSDLEEYARGKIKSKQIDMICANDVSAPQQGFSHDTNRIVIFYADGSSEDIGFGLKSELAVKIISSINRLIETNENKSGA